MNNRVGNRLTKVGRGVLLAVIALLLTALPVYAYLYRAQLVILEGNGVAYTMLPVSWLQGNTWMASNGFMTSTALDTRVETLGGSAKPHMVADDRSLTATLIPASSQTNLYFTTGNTALTSMDIITGVNGYVAVDNAPAALVLGDDFEIVASAFPLAGSELILKPGAIRAYFPTNTSITAYISEAEYNQAAEDSETWLFAGAALRAAQRFPAFEGLISSVQWHMGISGAPAGLATCNIRNATTDAVIGTIGTVNVGTLGAPAWITFNTTPLAIPTATDIRVTIEYGGGDGGNYVIVAFWGAGSVDTGVFSAYVGAAWTDWAARDGTVRVGWTTPDVTVTGAITQAAHVFRITADSANLDLYVDGGAALDSTALGGAAVPVNTNDWVLLQNVPYADYLRIYTGVGVTLIAHYQPITRIHGIAYSLGTVTVTNGDATVTGAGGAAYTGTLVGSLFVSADGVWYVVASVTDGTHFELATAYGGGTLGGQTYNTYPNLLDREGAAQNGAIHWGTNPAGITATIGSMTSSGQPTTTGGTDAPTSDLLPIAGGSNWNVAPAVGGTLATNPFRPFVTFISDNTTLTEPQTWIWLGLIFVAAVVALVGRTARGHQGITAIAAGVAVVALVVMTIFPIWALVFAILIILGGFISERSPSL